MLYITKSDESIPGINACFDSFSFLLLKYLTANKPLDNYECCYEVKADLTLQTSHSSNTGHKNNSFHDAVSGKAMLVIQVLLSM